MKQYIDKDAVMAEIKGMRDKAFPPNSNWKHGYFKACESILSFLDTLEVKEVDLKKEIYDAEKKFGDIDEMGGYRILIFDDEFRGILHHFFELGFKAQKEE